MKIMFETLTWSGEPFGYKEYYRHMASWVAIDNLTLG